MGGGAVLLENTTNTIAISLTHDGETADADQEQGGSDQKHDQHDDGVAVQAADGERRRCRRQWRRHRAGHLAVDARTGRRFVLQGHKQNCIQSIET